MKPAILISAILLTLSLSCDSGGRYENARTAEWYQKLENTEDENLRLSIFDTILEADPGDSYAYFERAALYKAAGKYDEAIQDFTRAERFDDPYRLPSLNEIFCSRGDVYTLLEKHYLAIEDYNKAILIDPESSRAYESRANVYMKMGRHDEALEDQQTLKELSSLGDVVTSE